MPFREAYKQVGNEVENNVFNYTGHLKHTHKGSIGNLCNPEIKRMMDISLEKFKQTDSAYNVLDSSV
jgi:argininosuccinate lyase